MIQPSLNLPVAPHNFPKNYQLKLRKQNSTLFKRQNGLCAYCDLPFTEKDPPTLDHIMPKSKGGSDKISNKALVHNSCNQIKGDISSYSEALLRAKDFMEMAKRLKDKGFLQ